MRANCNEKHDVSGMNEHQPVSAASRWKGKNEKSRSASLQNECRSAPEQELTIIHRSIHPSTWFSSSHIPYRLLTPAATVPSDVPS
jgi:hypothetical protein